MAELPALETIAVRLAIIGGALVAWFLTQRLIGLRRTSGDGIGDRLHDLTAGANQWLHRHPRAADTPAGRQFAGRRCRHPVRPRLRGAWP